MSDLEFHPLANFWPLLEGKDFEGMVADIRDNTQRNAGVLYQGKILDGRNRYRACKVLGVEPKPFEVFVGTDKEALKLVVSLNEQRRHESISQRAMIAAAIEQFQHGGNRQDANLHLDRSQAADAMGVSERSVAHAAVVKKYAIPEVQAMVTDGQMTVSAAASFAELLSERQREIFINAVRESSGDLKKQRRAIAAAAEEERAKFRQERPLPEGARRVIVVDFGWPMTKIELDVFNNARNLDYRTMTEEQILAFGPRIESIAADDCWLFLWTTISWLPFTMKLLEEWEWEYAFTMVWHKVEGNQPLGLPKFNCEFVVVARRGKPQFTDRKRFSCCFPKFSKKIEVDDEVAFAVENLNREHSQKPDEFYDMIARVTEGPRIDLFSRGGHEGFEAWGNEMDKFPPAKKAIQITLEDLDV